MFSLIQSQPAGVMLLEHAPAGARQAIRAAYLAWLADPGNQSRQCSGQLFSAAQTSCCAHGALALILAEAGYARITGRGVLACGVCWTGTLGDPVARALDLPPALLSRLTYWNDEGWSFAQIGRALTLDLAGLHLN